MCVVQRLVRHQGWTETTHEYVSQETIQIPVWNVWNRLHGSFTLLWPCFGSYGSQATYVFDMRDEVHEQCFVKKARFTFSSERGWEYFMNKRLKPGVHTNDFAPIHRLRALKLGHASLATVFRPGRLTLQPILRENLESPVLRYQPITTAVVTDACLTTRWHHGAYTSAVLRESLGLDRVVTVYLA